MRYLIKNCTIIHEGHPFHRQTVDILIDKGKIQKIETQLIDDKAIKIQGEELIASVGWFDIGTHLGEPGNEQNETLESLCAAALAGGYTGLAPTPNAIPTIQSKAQVEQLKSEGHKRGIDIHPLGAISQDRKGEDLTEMTDLSRSGVRGFFDGLKSISSGLLLRALQYVKRFDGVIFHFPEEKHLSEGHLVNEGAMSTAMGFKGSPSIAEEVTIGRDLKLWSYTESKLSIHGLSTLSSLPMLSDAKKQSSSLFIGVPYLNLVKNETALHGFDAHYKVKPVLRTEKDRQSLVKALKSGLVDYVFTNHVPWDTEHHDLEYAYAKHGAAGLELCGAAMFTNIGRKVDLEVLIKSLAIQSRKILDVDIPKMEVGETANLTIVDLNHPWTCDKKDLKSIAVNHPFIGLAFNAKVLATFNGKYVYHV